MLTITIPANEAYNEETQSFINVKEQTLELEHSLISLSKWESKWCKPFITKIAKTSEETIDYIKCMTLTKNVDPNVYLFLSNENIEAVNEYIAAPMTATVIRKDKNAPHNSEQITSEIIYYQMIALQIPFECQRWHLNRLLTLISVCSIKNAPPKKMGKRELASRNAALNAARRKQFNTSG